MGILAVCLDTDVCVGEWIVSSIRFLLWDLVASSWKEVGRICGRAMKLPGQKSMGSIVCNDKRQEMELQQVEEMPACLNMPTLTLLWQPMPSVNAEKTIP